MSETVLVWRVRLTPAYLLDYLLFSVADDAVVLQIHPQSTGIAFFGNRREVASEANMTEQYLVVFARRRDCPSTVRLAATRKLESRSSNYQRHSLDG